MLQLLEGYQISWFKKIQNREDINEIRKKLKLSLKIKIERCEWCDFKANHCEDWNNKRKLEKAVVKYYKKKKANRI